MKYYCQKCQQGYFILRKKALLDNLENLRKLTCKNCENLEDIDDVARLSTSWRC
jgi:predicted SprT family Zn-dependent metalloprotease